MSVLNIEYGYNSNEIIKRYYPSKESIISYPKRHTEAMLLLAKEMKNDPKVQEDYEKFKIQMEYNKSHRIKDCREEFINLKNSFLIWGVYFDKLARRNIKNYLAKTKKLYNEIDERNRPANEHNERVDKAIEEIDNLKSWNDFIVFNGEKYGLTMKVKNNIHIEDDCFGEFKFLREKIIKYKIENERSFMPAFDYINESYRIYKCIKCNKEEFINI